MDLVHILITVAVAVIVILVIYWLLQQVVLDPQIRRIVNIAAVVIVAIIAIIFLLQFGGMGGTTIRVP
jgi:hypothetical protein